MQGHGDMQPCKSFQKLYLAQQGWKRAGGGGSGQEPYYTRLCTLTEEVWIFS